MTRRLLSILGLSIIGLVALVVTGWGAVYWMGPAIAHMFVSFGLGDQHLPSSIEVQRGIVKVGEEIEIVAVHDARLYQIENKLRALVSYELAREIPLLK
jgi:uncharacterized protein (DUF58 family)